MASRSVVPRRRQLLWLLLPCFFVILTTGLLVLDPFESHCRPSELDSSCISAPRLIVYLMDGPGFFFPAGIRAVEMEGKFFEFRRLFGVFLMWLYIGWVWDRRRDRHGLACIGTRWIRDAIYIPALVVCAFLLALTTVNAVASSKHQFIALHYLLAGVSQYGLLPVLQGAGRIFAEYGLTVWLLGFLVHFIREVFFFPVRE
jgi:hypothetical protein